MEIHSTNDRDHPCSPTTTPQASSVTGETSQVVASETNKPSRIDLGWPTSTALRPLTSRPCCSWLDTAHAFHTDPVRDVIVALRTVEQPAPRPGEAPLIYGR